MRLSPLLVLPLAACAPELGVDSAATHGLCPAALCGGNSPQVGHYDLWELNLDQKVNSTGFVLLGLTQGNEAYDVEVVNSEIIAHGAWRDLKGTDLIGAQLWLDLWGRQFAVIISDVHSAEEVVAPGTPLATYTLDWDAVIGRALQKPLRAGDWIELPILTGETEPVCADPLEDGWDGRSEWDETSGMNVYASVVFEGDRIDAATRTIDPTPDDRWFDIGCVADTLAKLRLTRSTIHTAASWQQAQATLKMLSADYCGAGTAFTFPGEPLVWRNVDVVNMEYWRQPTSLEARWNQDGALCIYAPRLIDTSNPAAKMFGDIWTAVEDECRRVGHQLDKCNEPDPYVQEFPDELITSANRN